MYFSYYQGDPKTVRLSQLIAKYKTLKHNHMLNPAAIIPSTKKHILMVSLNKSAKSVTVVCFQFAIFNLRKIHN
jgi:hypothetical protein